MRVPLTWLREYCDPDLDVKGIEERLTMTGTKVEAIHHYGVGSPERFVVGRVQELAAHPDADRLKVCRVDLGAARREGPASIVCGASNVAAGQAVAVACPGAVMPDGSEVGQAKLRGVVSEGMILSEDELAIGAGGKGILVLSDVISDSELAPGTPLGDVLPIATEVLALEITPNRPDCLGVYGVARELHAAIGAPLSAPPWAEDAGSAGPIQLQAPPEVIVDCPDLCPRFTARVFEDVTIAQSPPWLKARLMAAGQRPINNVVDITNYAMLVTGQPLHAFDLDRVAGGRLTVRRAREGEQLQTLDGETRTLDSGMVVIEDLDGPTSIAGLMGGARSEVQPDTRRVLLEVATWSGPNIHRGSVSLGLRSEASSRFEKGLAPEQCMQAQAVATELIVKLCGARVVNGTIDVGGEGSDRRSEIGQRVIRLRESRVRAILGVSVPVERQAEILRSLDFQAERVDDGLDVIVPAVRRGDVGREADLIEEVARINGLERLPATLPKRRGAYGLLSPEQRLRRRTVDALTGRGLYEVVGWTFTSPILADRLRLGGEDSRRRAPALENPLSEDQSLLRTTLLGSLLDAARHNVSRGILDLRLFEIGTVFNLGGLGRSPNNGARASSWGTGIDERRSLAVLMSGRLEDPSWGVDEPPIADFFAAKGVLEELARTLRVGGVEFVPEAQPFLHPGQSAAVVVGGTSIGWLGQLHPLVAETWELRGASALEVDLDRLIENAATTSPGGGGPDLRSVSYEDLIGYPPLREDLAVILPEHVPAGQVLDAVRAAAGELLRDVQVFDVYTGPQVGEGRRSLALALSFRSSERTLTDDDVAPVRERIVAALGELGGELRD
jgi:phenylalanyl-tRNA synthetase beta chain